MVGGSFLCEYGAQVVSVIGEIVYEPLGIEDMGWDYLLLSIVFYAYSVALGYVKIVFENDDSRLYKGVLWVCFLDVQVFAVFICNCDLAV